jgi:hypothetical protein
MKTYLLVIALAVLITPVLLVAQENKLNEPVVKTAVYFDKTPPLRDMKIVVAGARDRSWKDGIIGNKTRDESLLYANQPEVPYDLVQQKEMGTRNVSGPILNFPGVGRITLVSPPDTEGDVGPNHYFQMINLSFAIWDKQGTLLYGPVDNSTLWDGFIGAWTGTNDGDPIVLYDDYADRWVATQLAVNTTNGTHWQLIAVSETADPLGAYYRYAFQFTLFNDYPKFSIWPDGYYSTYNMFSSVYAGNIAAVMDRDAILIGDPNAQMIQFGPFPNQYGAKSAHLDGPTLPPADAPNWVVNLVKYGTQKLEVYKFETDWNTPANSSYSLHNALTVTPFSFFDPSIRPQLPQPNSSQLLDPLSKYLMNPLYYRNFGSYETMVVNHTVKLGSRAGIRWYELRKDSGQNDWYIYQEGTYAPADDLSRWMASIAMNVNGDIALGYSVTGDTTYPQVAYTGRSAGSPLGVMDVEEFIIAEGNGSQNGTARWGDYSALSVDPVDDLTFWYTGEYMPGSVWGTRITSFDLGAILPPTAFAGDDSEICSEEAYYGQGSATSQQSVLWTSDGDGTLINQTTLTPAYIRGSQDLENGYFELVLTAYGFEPGMEASDTVHVDIIDDVVVDLGNDTLICQDETLQLNPSVINGDSLMWTTSGDGSFNIDTIQDPMYTPGPQDISDGEVTLSLYATAIAPCEGEDEDDLLVTIDACTGIDDLNTNRIALHIYPNPSTGIFNIEVSGYGEESFDLSVMNLQGQMIFTGNLNMNAGAYSNRLDLSYLPRGVYYVMIRTENSTSTKKIIFE